MRLLCRVAFNASPPTTHPTEAQLYREAARRSGLQAFDEMDNFRDEDLATALKEMVRRLIELASVMPRTTE